MAKSINHQYHEKTGTAKNLLHYNFFHLMRKSSQRRILWVLLLLIFIAIAVPLTLQIRSKLYPAHLINQKGIPEILQKIDDDDVSCTISSLGKKVTLTKNQLKTLNACLNKFAREANVEFYEPSLHSMSPECVISYNGKQSDKHPWISIFVYVHGRMMEIPYENGKFVFTFENQDLFQLMNVVQELCPSPDMKSTMEAIRQTSE